MKTILLMLSVVGFCFTGQAGEKKTIACTLPIVEALAREVGGKDFEYFSLVRADQDPHEISVTPILQRRLREADAFLEIGLSLDRWADQVADGSGKPRLQRGGDNRFIVSKGIAPLQIPSEVSRALGHIHPEGNPHIWIDPLRAKKMATTIASALERVSPGHRDRIQDRLKAFHRKVNESLYGTELVEGVGAEQLDRWLEDGQFFDRLQNEELAGKKLREYLGGWLERAAPLRGRKVVEFHKVWTYLTEHLGLEIVGSIEENPGIPPGPRHLVELTRKIREEKAAAIMVDNFYDFSQPKRISEDTGCPMVVLPNQPGGEPGTETYVRFVDEIVARLLKEIVR